MSKNNTRNAVQVNKYVVVPDDESRTSHSETHQIPEAIPVLVEDLLSPALGRVDQTFGSIIPEAAGLTWNDGFFDDEDDIIAVFDFDYDEMEKNCMTATWIVYFSSLCICPAFFWIGALLQFPCYIGNNVVWHIRSQHLAVSRRGVFFVHDSRKSFWGFPCSDFGRTQVIIPFKEIKTCKLEAGSKNLVIVENPNVLPRYLKFNLKNALQFQTLVSAMIQKSDDNATFGCSRGTRSSAATAARAAAVMNRAEATIGDNNDQNVAILLSDIRDELRRHNQRADNHTFDATARELI